MAVYRIARTRDYTVMANHHLRNRNLSLKAKGLLSVMLSLCKERGCGQQQKLRRRSSAPFEKNFRIQAKKYL